MLIADDSPTIRAFVRLALRDLPIGLVEAEDGAQALERARASRPALALIDVNMPVLDGLGAVRALRSDPDPALRALPVLLLTCERNEAAREACLAAGANGIVDKPLRIPELRAAVERLLGATGGAGSAGPESGGGR